MVRNVFPNLPDLLTPRINAKLPKPEGFAGACFEVGHHFENGQIPGGEGVGGCPESPD